MPVTNKCSNVNTNPCAFDTFFKLLFRLISRPGTMPKIILPNPSAISANQSFILATRNCSRTHWLPLCHVPGSEIIVVSALITFSHLQLFKNQPVTDKSTLTRYFSIQLTIKGQKLTKVFKNAFYCESL